MSVMKPIAGANPGVTPGVFIYAGGFAPIGGIETFLADLSQGLVRAGVQVELLVWNRQSKLLNNIREAGVRVYCSPWRWGCRWAWPDWLLLPFGILKCRKSPVVLFGKTFRPAIQDLIYRFGKVRGRHQRFIYVTEYRPAELWSWVRGEGEKKKVAAMLNAFDLIVSQNSMFADDLRTLGYQGPIELLPNLPPPATEKPAPYPDGPLTIGFLGRLEHQKNLPALLNIFALLNQQEARCSNDAPQLRLRLIGEGSQRASLMSLAGELGIAHSVEFCGAVPRERVREAIQRCHLFCFTSRTEGQPIASLEVLAEGRPIIATSVGAFPDMLTNPALGAAIPPGDESAFLSAVSDVLARQKSRLLCPQDTVRAYQAKFDPKAVLRKYIELLSPDAAARDWSFGKWQPEATSPRNL